MTHDDPAPVSDLLAVLEDYYDAAPRVNTTPEEVGPFTLFVAGPASTWQYYARPRLGLTEAITHDDVARVRARQRELGLAEKLEWVQENTPTLLASARSAGLAVEECPLLVLRREPPAATPAGVGVQLLDPGSPALPEVLGAIHAGFDDSSRGVPRSETVRVPSWAAGRTARAGPPPSSPASRCCPVPAAGASAPRSPPRWWWTRGRFVRVGTACIAEPPGDRT